jgi:putative transposase
MRHTTFRFTLDPTPEQVGQLARHAGASRFAYNQCLRFVTNALASRKSDPTGTVPWSSFDLINAFNTWKRSKAAGRIFVVAQDGIVTELAVGLTWRNEVSAQVFEEAAVDLGRALAAYGKASSGTLQEHRSGFPRPKRKGHCRDSFRMRNRISRSGRCHIRIGEGNARTILLPTIGVVRVHDDTRRLRRLLRPVEHHRPLTGSPALAPRARLLFATVARHGNRWLISLNVEAPDFHAERRHHPPSVGWGKGFVGIDRGIAAFAVAATADGLEVARFHAPRPLARRLSRIQRRAQAVSRAKRGSRNRTKAVSRLVREHARIANIRQNSLHRVSSQLAKTHSQLAIEDLATANLIRNKHLSRAIADVGWGELARQLAYKADWFGGELVTCDRWFASTRICSACGTTKKQLGLAERTFRCSSCGLIVDRDTNAAANLAAWADAAVLAPAQAPDRQAGGRITKASGGGTRAASSASADRLPKKEEPTLWLQPEPRTPEKGDVGQPTGCATCWTGAGTRTRR